MTLQKNLSKMMNAIRAGRKQSITDFSEELGISRSSMQGLLKGNANPRMDTVEHIATRLQVDPLSLLACPYSEPELECAFLLLQCVEAFSQLPEDKKLEAAALFHSLIKLMRTEP